MAGAQIPTSVTILQSLHGFMALSLTEYNTSAAASIAAGSVVEIAGAFFNFPADEAIEASTWTSIVTGNTAYIALTASGTAGSQVVSATYTSTAPTWRDDLQGWYASAASSVRIVGSVYKAEATNYGPKYLYSSMQENKQRSIVCNNATVTSSMAIVGNASVSGTLSVSSSISPSGIVPFSYIHATSGTTINNVFDAISPAIPTTGQSILMTGIIVTFAGTSYTTIRATRDSSTTITIYGSTITTGIGNVTLTDGSATLVGFVSLAW